MAITVTELWPADAETRVTFGQRPRFRITDGTAADLDLSLIELILDGTSYTYDAGELFVYETADISGGAVVADTSDVLVELDPSVSWWPGELLEVAFDVDYDSINLSSTTFITGHIGGPNAGGSVPAVAALTTVAGLTIVQIPRSDGVVAGGAVVGSRGRTSYPVEGLVRSLMFPRYDAYGYVAELIVQAMLGSVVVGDPDWQTLLGSVVVQGDRLQGASGSAVVQGTVWQSTLGSLVVGVQYITQFGASAVVSLQTLSVVPGSAVVRGVHRGSVIEVEVRDATTIAALAAMGVTFG